MLLFILAGHPNIQCINDNSIFQHSRLKQLLGVLLANRSRKLPAEQCI